MRRVIALLCISIVMINAFEEWTPDSYPNPRKGGFKNCSMRSISNICDPDQVLSESDRYRLNNELSRLMSRSGSDSNNFCERKGMDAVLAIVPEGSQDFANKLLQNWKMDNQCQKSVVFVFSSDERHLYYAGDQHTGINTAEFEAIAYAAKSQLSAGHYVAGLTNIFKELGKMTNPALDNLTTSKPIQGNTSSSFLFIFSIIFSILFTI